MVFSNLFFLFFFLPILLILHVFIKKTWRNFLLLVASVLFYAWGEPKYVFLILFSIGMNYSFGLLIDRYHEKKHIKKLIVVLSIVSNLGILGFFKYANFFIDNVNLLLHTNFQLEPIPLPLGISFCTFHALSYVIDVYRKDVKVQKNFLDLSLYMLLFPQLVAGPIVRYNTIADEIKKRYMSLQKFAEGTKRFIMGLSKKVLLANPLGELADHIFALNPSEMSVTTAWVGIIAYTLQIYFDFSGYSDMAIGLGKMFGFTFLENFNYPYISKSVSEFWRRWHISLSSWFRDYVYIPLGGNRVSTIKIYRNILIVWTITGFWHGASWTFLMWGFYYGFIICLERMGLEKIMSKLWSPIRHIYVMLIVLVGWVFFRADNPIYALDFIKVMFGFGDNSLIYNTDYVKLSDNLIVFCIAILLSTPIYPYLKEKFTGQYIMPISFSVGIEIAKVTGYVILLFLVTVMLVNSTYNPFIYFRF